MPQTPPPPPPQTTPTFAPAYHVETIAIPSELTPEIGAIDFAPDGRLWVGSRRGIVWRVDLAAGKWEVFAEGLHEVTGLQSASSPHELYVCDRPSLVRVRDLDGDFVADDYESLSEAWGLSGNYHEYAFGPVRADDGSFFVGLGCGSDLGGIAAITRGAVSPFGRVGRMFSAVPWRGWIVRVTADGTTTPWAKGFREPNGLVLSPDGDLFVTDNQGDWRGTSELHHVQRGGFYGHPSSLVWDPGFTGDPLALPIDELEKMRQRPIVLFPHNRCCNSPTQPLFLPSDGSFGPFRGQMILGDIPEPRLLRVFLEKIGEEFQGAVFPFIEREGLRNGNNRFAFAPGGGALVIGQGSRGWADGEGLQRVVWSGRTPMELLALRAQRDGFELEFTKPLDPGSLTDPSRCSLEHYHYEYHRPYGSPEIGLTIAPVQRIELAADARRARLVVGELVTGEVYELHVQGARASDGEPLCHPTAWYTLNRLPE